jgi:hypothetical protein
MASSSTIDRVWIVSEFVKLIDAERSRAADARARADSPPVAALSVLYHEIAAADERHGLVLETIATRYGHTPSRSVTGGVSETLGRLKDAVATMGASPLDRISTDLAAKADAIHWQAAWLSAFEAIGDAESARDLAAMLTEDRAHYEALQQGLNRLVELHAVKGDDVKA